MSLKDYCVIFDTNTLLGNKKKLFDIKTKIELSSDIFIPRMVIDEVKAHKSREIREDFLQIKSIIDKNSGLFKYNENFKIDDVILKNEKSICKWLSDYCNNNIIERDDISLDDIIERANKKITPFNKDKQSSDKGFKDTIIWLSILNNKTINDYKKIIIVSSDKDAFIKNVKDLNDEYKECHDNTLEICSNIDELYEKIGIIKSEEETIVTNNDNKISINTIEELREKINVCVNKILYNVYEDDWGNQYSEKIFNIYDKMDNSDVECFLSLLGDFLKDNLFFENVDISDLLNGCGIRSAGEEVSSQYLNELNEIYNNIKQNEELYKPFLKLLKTEFNKLYIYKAKSKSSPFDGNDDADLPF